MKHGDIFDRYTILLMKSRLDEGAQIELADYEAEVVGWFGEDPAKSVDCLGHMLQLMESNAKIWITEASIRKEYSDDPDSREDLSLDEIGRRSVRIREYNKMRVQAKNKIDEAFGNIPDRKVDHASE